MSYEPPTIPSLHLTVPPEAEAPEPAPPPSPSSDLLLSPGLETNSPSSTDGAHLDDAARAAGIDTAPVAVALDGGADLWARDQWCSGWLMYHRMIGALPMVNSAALKSVPDRAGAMEAARCIYDTAAETPMLRFLIEKKSRWFERVTVIGAFYTPLVMEIRAERAARIVRPAQQPVRATGAGDSEAATARAMQGAA